jgi:hypothetical protein
MVLDTPLNDDPTNFFLRVILEKKFKTVFELGSYSCQRIITLKKLVPEIDAVALDILPQYEKLDGAEMHGVKIKFFKPDTFRKITADNALLIVRGTLTYIPTNQLYSMFVDLHKAGVSIAFCEPVPLFEINTSVPRAADSSYYHAYEKMLSACGYSLLQKTTATKKYRHNVGYAEAWTFNFATPT